MSADAPIGERRLSSWRLDLDRARAIAWKDLTLEQRTRANFNGVAFLAVLILLMFGFALGPDAEALRTVSTGVVWLTVLFSGVLSFNRSFQMELDGGALDVLLMYPGRRWPLFVGKLAANLGFVLLVEVIVLPLAAILYHVPLFSPFTGMAGVLLLGTLGFVTLGTFYAAMASRVRAREVLLPLLLFPMLVPLLIAAVGASKAVLGGDPMGDAAAWLRMLVAFDVIFLTGAVLVFEYVIEG